MASQKSRLDFDLTLHNTSEAKEESRLERLGESRSENETRKKKICIKGGLVGKRKDETTQKTMKCCLLAAFSSCRRVAKPHFA